MISGTTGSTGSVFKKYLVAVGSCLLVAAALALCFYGARTLIGMASFTKMTPDIADSAYSGMFDCGITGYSPSGETLFECPKDAGTGQMTEAQKLSRAMALFGGSLNEMHKQNCMVGTMPDSLFDSQLIVSCDKKVFSSNEALKELFKPWPVSPQELAEKGCSVTAYSLSFFPTSIKCGGVTFDVSTSWDAVIAL